MTEKTQVPAASPTGGQGTGAQPDAGKGSPATTQPGQSPGEKGQEGQDELIQIPLNELNTLKRKSGRWDARKKNDRKTRRNERGSKDQNLDNANPEHLEQLNAKDQLIEEQNSKLTLLEVGRQVRDILDNDEYKDLPDGIKRAVKKNPTGFASPDSDNITDIVEDIREYLDDELDKAPPSGSQLPADQTPEGEKPKVGDQPIIPEKRDQTPPASGSGPSAPIGSEEESIVGKTGPARSTAILRGLLKKKG